MAQEKAQPGELAAAEGDHRHVGGEESVYHFTTLEALLNDFERDVTTWR
jgi:hypothetical protein